MESETKSMSVKLRSQDRDRLRRLAEARKRTPHWLAKEAILQFLEREEAVENFRQESLTAWGKFEKTGESVSNEQVMDWLNSWDTEDEIEAPEWK